MLQHRIKHSLLTVDARFQNQVIFGLLCWSCLQFKVWYALKKDEQIAFQKIQIIAQNIAITLLQEYYNLESLKGPCHAILPPLRMLKYVQTSMETKKNKWWSLFTED